MKPLIRDFALVTAASALFGLCVLHQFDFYKDWNQGSGKFIQRVNIPSEDAIKIMALGYDNAYADMMTLTAIQNFGAAWDTEEKVIEPIYNYFDVLTELDPHFVEVFELGNLVLSDTYGSREENKGHYLSIELMRKGNYKNPYVWKIPYLALYTAIWGLNEEKLAKSFLPILKRIPETPDHVLRIEEYIERKSGRYQVAFDVNLQQYLSYVTQGKKDEENVAVLKLKTIIDGWYKTQIATVADQYFNDKGVHPTSIEELLTPPYKIEFEAPTVYSIIESINNHIEDPGNLESKKDVIRDEAMVQIVGLPPDPEGYWYHINSLEAFRANKSTLDKNAPLLDRFSYISSTKPYFDKNNEIAFKAQQFIQQYIASNSISPSYDEMKPYIVPDSTGGHFIYIQEVTGSDGKVLPRFYSTSSVRMDQNHPDRDPRIGLSGTLDQFPKRRTPYNGLPDYLTAEPTIWDFEEDAIWALCNGFQPGIKLQDQQELLLEVSDPNRVYFPCDDHIILPELMK